MIPILTLAQARLPEISPGFLTSWLAVFLLFGGLMIMLLSAAVMTMNLLEKLRAKKKEATAIEPNPLQVQEVQPLATRAELVSMENRLTARIKEVETDLASDRNETREETGRLHGRIDELVDTAAETKGILGGVKDNTDMLITLLLKKGAAAH